jgi:nucleoid-associated protein YgaU
MLMKRTPLFFSLIATCLFLHSCGDGASENYDTPPTSGYTGTPVNPPPHPTYGDAAYEPQAVTDPQAALNPTVPGGPAVVAPPMNPANANGARDHYVAPGDSLWKISRIYKVPVESIKQANGMTNDTVILGKKLIIPAE